MERVCSVCRDAFAEMPPDTATVELPACHHVFVLRGMLGRLVERICCERVEQLP